MTPITNNVFFIIFYMIIKFVGKGTTFIWKKQEKEQEKTAIHRKFQRIAVFLQ